MVVLTLGGGELGLEFGQRAGLRPRPRFPPSGGGGEVLLPGIKPVGFEAQFLRDHRGRLATAMPVLERFALEGFIEFTTDFNRCLVHGTSFHCSPNSPSVNSKQPQKRSFQKPINWRKLQLVIARKCRTPPSLQQSKYLFYLHA